MGTHTAIHRHAKVSRSRCEDVLDAVAAGSFPFFGKLWSPYRLGNLGSVLDPNFSGSLGRTRRGRRVGVRADFGYQDSIRLNTAPNTRYSCSCSADPPGWEQRRTRSALLRILRLTGSMQVAENGNPMRSTSDC